MSMIGTLVRYVGSQYPDLAGCEGPVHSVGVNAWGDTVYSVAWHGRFGRMSTFDSKPMTTRDIKPIRKYSKGISHV